MDTVTRELQERIFSLEEMIGMITEAGSKYDLDLSRMECRTTASSILAAKEAGRHFKVILRVGCQFYLKSPFYLQ